LPKNAARQRRGRNGGALHGHAKHCEGTPDKAQLKRRGLEVVTSKGCNRHDRYATQNSKTGGILDPTTPDPCHRDMDW
jgi:hypothetical protein